MIFGSVRDFRDIREMVIIRGGPSLQQRPTFLLSLPFIRRLGILSGDQRRDTVKGSNRRVALAFDLGLQDRLQPL